MKRKRLAATIVFIVLSLFVIGQFTMAADISDAGELGDITHYNAFIFGDVESEKSDIEGAMAVGGEANLATGGQYDVGASAHSSYGPVTIGKYENTNGYPTLLADGLPTSNGYVNVYGGSIALNESLQAEYEGLPKQLDGTLKYVDSNVIDNYFADAKEQIVNMVRVLSLANKSKAVSVSDFCGDRTTANYTFANLEEFEPDNLDTGETGIALSKVLVINVASGDNVTINEPHLNSAFEEYSLIIFNFQDAEEVLFTGGSVHVDNAQLNTSAPAQGMPADNALLKKYCEKIIWNFPVATNVEVSGCGVAGSVLAPNAHLYGYGGSINGMLIADSFTTTNGMEVHGFALDKSVFEFVNLDEAPTGSVTLSKMEEGNTAKVLEDAKFHLEHYDEEEQAWQRIYSNLETNRFGLIHVEDLPYGTYRFIEIEPPEGYLMPEGEDIYLEFEIDDDHGVDAALKLTKTNEPETNTPEPPKPTTDITLNKTDGNDPLDGAKFELFLEDGEHLTSQGEVVSQDGGFVRLTGLKEGRYHLFEMEAPEDYEIPDAYAHIIIDIVYDGGTNTFTITYTMGDDSIVSDLRTIINEPVTEREVTGVLSILKLDGDESAVKGAIFTLYLWDDVQQEFIEVGGCERLETDNFGIIRVADLPSGTYKIVEAEAPAGYVKDENHFEEVFEVSEQEQTFSYTFYNEKQSITAPLGSFSIEKVDAANEDVKLKGAVFALYKEMDTGMQIVADDITTNENGYARMDGLEEGWYWLREVAAPNGYLLSDDDDAVRFYIEGEDGYHKKIAIENEQALAKARLLKVVKDTDTPISGVVFSLYKYNASSFEYDYVGRHETDQNGFIHLNSLAPGQYRLAEEYNPNPGFASDASVLPEVLFTVEPSANGMETDLGQFTVENIATLTLKKVDLDTKTALPGAEFQLFYQEERTQEWRVFEERVMMDDAGIAKIDGLMEGSYKLVETKTPNGYEANSKSEYVFFVVSNGVGKLHIVSENEMIEIDGLTLEISNGMTSTEEPALLLYKVDAKDSAKKLSGAVFELYLEEETEQTLVAAIESDDTGRIALPHLEDGTYHLREVTAPKGYMLDGAEHKIDIVTIDEERAIYWNGTWVNHMEPSELYIANNINEDTLTGGGMKTGDSSKPLMYLLCGIGLVLCVIYLKKKSNLYHPAHKK